MLRYRRSLPGLQLGAVATPFRAYADPPAWEYELGKVLGTGSFSVVRLAIRRSDGKQFAVKCVSAGDEEQQESARREYEIMRMLCHPALLSAESLHTSRDVMHLYLEFCEGGNILDFVEGNGPFWEDEAPVLFEQFFCGIDYLHHRRIVHRDVKNANLLLTGQSRELKIADFGSAAQIGHSAGCTSHGMLSARCGTRIWAAPELIFGRQWNERVDIWSCGLCLYFMLRGTLPFDIDACNVKRCLQSGRLPEIEWGRLSTLSQNIVQQCLRVDFRDRPPAMELQQHPMLVRLHEFQREFTPLDEVISPAEVIRVKKMAESMRSFTFDDSVHSCGLLAGYLLGDGQSVEVRGNSQKPAACGGRGTASERGHARHLQHLAERRYVSSPKGSEAVQIIEEGTQISFSRSLLERSGTEATRCSSSLAMLSRSLSAPGELGAEGIPLVSWVRGLSA